MATWGEIVMHNDYVKDELKRFEQTHVCKGDRYPAPCESAQPEPLRNRPSLRALIEWISHPLKTQPGIKH